MARWTLLILALVGGVFAVGTLRRRMSARSASRRSWRRLLGVGGIALLVVVLGVYVGLAYTRAQMMVHPGRQPVRRTFADVGVAEFQTVSFLTGDGLRLYGWYVPPRNGATVVFVHGFAANRAGLLDDAALLVQHSYGALVFDLRNSGESEGDLTTLGYLEVEDVRAAVAFVLAQPETDPERIGLLGHSMGGATVIRAAARIPEVGAVVAESAYASLEDEVEAGVRAIAGLPPFPFAPLIVWFGEREAGLKIGEVRPVGDIAGISPRPVLLVHGDLDETVPVSNGLRLYEAAREPKEFYLVAGAGHGGFLQAHPEEYERRVVGFFERYLVIGDR